jgi:hypothetical protein
MELTTLVGGGAVAGIIIAAWDYVKVYLNKIYSLAFITLDLEEERFEKVGVVWINSKCKNSRLSVKSYTVLNSFVKPVEKNQVVAFERPSKVPTLYWYGKIPIIFTADLGHYKLTFMRGTLKSEKIIEDMVDTYNSTLGDNIEENRFYIRKFHGTLLTNKNNQVQSFGNASASPTAHHDDDFYKSLENSLIPIKWKKDQIGQNKKLEPLGHLALSGECQKVVDNLKLWRKSESWYKSKQIPWKKGILLFGSPGTGKSSLSKALAMELNMPIMVFDLSSMSNNDFQEAWANVKSNSPCMVLFEDIDGIFNLRENVTGNEGGITFDTLLNCLDGVENADGLLIVVTTNDINAIDPALGRPTEGSEISSRPGRIDLNVELKSPDKDGLRKIACRILVDYPGEIDRIVEEGIRDTGAQFQERCSRLALKMFWESKNEN